MLYYDKIDLSEGIDVNKTYKLRKCVFIIILKIKISAKTVQWFS